MSFKTNYLENYYNLAKSEFGISEIYGSEKSDIDLICTLKQKIRSCYNKTDEEIQINGKNVDIEVFKIYLENKINIKESDTNYSDVVFKTLLISIGVSQLNKLIPSECPYWARASTVMITIILIIIMIPFSSYIQKNIYDNKISIAGFYRLALRILKEVEKE
ncbi:hypothetical protein [Clostridium botulinum]|uniref:hypothetical protein n=1 Tax=Clostridium botulinum TaxID=1491 RepID=UPI00069B8B36|nr:hypothetical protein [Clostridium botulinum]KOA90859.1 hypothetical protein ADU76_12450 [Clostridium botulinum]MCD3203422.1 hypothetical protein [Clostridium botulinum C/D]MCD3222285.1 hypothetical protein [Clostridium botulinum C/D]MCD3231444.1 hypothetical protein [Clostridium botulinum C/D]MCD3273058.1 hypothetical protein [Clostridium botulinum C/D]